MGKSLNQILSAQVLTKLVNTINPGLPNPLPAASMTIKGQPVPQNYGTYTLVGSTRKTSRLTQYGAPSVPVQLSPIGAKTITLPSFANNILLKQADYMNLRNFDNPAVQILGEREVDRQVGQLKLRNANTKISMLATLFANGKAWWNNEGNMLNSSSGAFTTIDYEVPTSTNTGDLGGILTNWSTATTDIIGQIEQVKSAALRITGYPLVHAIYGSNIANYIASNNGIRNFIRASQPLGSEFYATGVIPSQLCGLNWIPGYNMFYEKEDGTLSNWFDPDAVTFIPEFSPSWFEWLEGHTPVVSDVGKVDIGSENVQDNIITVPGEYSYAVAVTDPVTIKVVSGYVGLPIVTVPGSIFLGHTTN